MDSASLAKRQAQLSYLVQLLTQESVRVDDAKAETQRLITDRDAMLQNSADSGDQSAQLFM